MAVPQVRRFCCGFTLERGSLIIGWIGLILGALGLIATQILETKPGPYQDMTNRILIYCEAANIIVVLFSVLLIVGVKNRMHKCLKVWVVVSFIGMVINTVSLLTLGGLMVVDDSDTSICLFVIAIITAPIATYFIIVVYNLSRNLSMGINQS